MKGKDFMNEIQRPIITIKRVFADKRSAVEAFATVLAREIDRRSIRTFETMKPPQYTGIESEGSVYDTDATA